MRQFPAIEAPTQPTEALNDAAEPLAVEPGVQPASAEDLHLPPEQRELP
jgi:hypothetical protein